MNTEKRYQWTESQARQVLARADKHGQSVAKLARELGVSPQRIYWWRKRLQKSSPAPTGFVEVTVAPPRSHQAFTVHTAAGRRIEVWPGFDETELARLLAALEKASC